MERLHISDTEAMLAFGRRMADASIPACVIYLHGPLGAGKTTLVRGLLEGLGHYGPVKSPTYTLVETYRIFDIVVYHWDMYRISDPAELEYLGIRDYNEQPAWWLVEWPEKAGGILPPADLNITINVEGSVREVICEVLTDIGRQLLKN